jgi:signal peptidase II
VTLPANEVYTRQNWKRLLADFATIIGGAGLIIFLDQWTKTLVRENIPFTQSWLPESLDWLYPYARIVHWKNTGAAFGLFQDSNTFFMILAVVAGLFILYIFPQVERSDWPLRFAMVFQLGGAIGNLMDRILVGSVTDFISVFDFPVFNIADSSITIGVAVLLLAVVVQEIRERRKEEPDEGVSSDEPASSEENLT